MGEKFGPGFGTLPGEFHQRGIGLKADPAGMKTVYGEHLIGFPFFGITHLAGGDEASRGSHRLLDRPLGWMEVEELKRFAFTAREE